MTRAANEPEPEPEPEHEGDHEGGSPPADPDAPGRSLFEEEDDAVEPNEPA
ncbi:MAG TPA: hypothetical protein VM282_19235 [Acidimicrobiales bacterium]|nr:hypothetical protein [Acidimicrobiales bacterium]